MQAIQTPPAVHARPVAEPSGGQMVDALHTAFGEHHARAVHAKGIMAIGEFTPSPAAHALVRASLFTRAHSDVLVRFSDFTGIPDIPDTEGAANPRGLAIKFYLKDGATMDVVAHSFNGFPTATSAEFRELLIAIGTSGPAAPKPTALDAFLASHPVAKTFLTTQKPAPVSYTTLSYFGVNSFRFTNEQGHASIVRYRFIPADGEAYLPAGELASRSPNYLASELPTRLATTPAMFEWYAQISEPGDAIENPSIAWPESRRLVHLGTIRITGMSRNAVRDDQATMFLPTNVPAGIEPADPMLIVRKNAYPISFSHRQ